MWIAIGIVAFVVVAMAAGMADAVMLAIMVAVVAGLIAGFASMGPGFILVLIMLAIGWMILGGAFSLVVSIVEGIGSLFGWIFGRRS